MDKYSFIVLIVLIVTVAGVFRARYTHKVDGAAAEPGGLTKAEATRMEEEMRALKQRIAVLERIATDRNHLLEQEIESLRDR